MNRALKIDTMSSLQQNIEDFYNIGYFVVRGLFSKSEIDEISQAFDRLQKVALTLKTTQVLDGSQFVVEDGRIDRIVWMGGAEPSLLKVGEDPRTLGICSALLGTSTMEQLICQGHYKLSGDQVKFDWHQDCQHRGYGTPDWTDVNGRGSYVQTLMAIDEVTADNGPVMFIPCSAEQGYLGLDRVSDPSTVISLKNPTPMLMQPGDIAFFSPYSVHGSQPNISGKSRRVFINGFAHPGANHRKYPGEGSGRTVHYKG